jgi:hypothetical protein
MLHKFDIYLMIILTRLYDEMSCFQALTSEWTNCFMWRVSNCLSLNYMNCDIGVVDPSSNHELAVSLIEFIRRDFQIELEERRVNG